MYMVLCNQDKCHTLFPHKDIKHQGPCSYCFNKIAEKKNYDSLLHRTVKDKDPEATEELAYHRDEDLTF